VPAGGGFGADALALGPLEDREHRIADAHKVLVERLRDQPCTSRPCPWRTPPALITKSGA
jgi:hypothetical protein